MAKVVRLAAENQGKFGYKRVRKRKKKNLEDFGQLNLFTQPPSEAKVVRFNSYLSPFEEALVADEEERTTAARELYLKAVTANDCVADAYCNLGILESDQGNTAKAIDYFAQSLKHEPRHFEAHYNLANIYSEIGNNNLAQTHYEVAIEICPEFYNSYYNLALIHAANRSYKDAFHLLNHFIELAPEDEQTNAQQLLHSLRISIASNK